MNKGTDHTSSPDDSPTEGSVQDAALLSPAEDDPPPSEGSSSFGTVQAKHDQLYDQLVRLTADFENYKRRTRRELEEAKTVGMCELASAFLPVFDNLERAANAADQAVDVQSVAEGVRMVLRLFEDTAERIGLVRVAGVGQPFDPNIHEAIQQMETDEQPPGTIVAEVAPGYRLAGRLLRASLVVVARAKQTTGRPDDANSSGL